MGDEHGMHREREGLMGQSIDTNAVAWTCTNVNKSYKTKGLWTEGVRY